jgi:hypothetical protein
MKKVFVIFLCCSILLHGCQSYTSLTRENGIEQIALSEKDFIITLTDDSVIKSRPYHHIYTAEPGDFIFGSGKRKHRFVPGEHIPYVGRVERASIDSLNFIGESPERYLICYLPDSTDIYYQEGDYIVITPDQPPGLWCTGTRTADGNDSIFSGRIPYERIRNIEIKKFDPLRTIACFACVVGIVLVVVGIHQFSSMKPPRIL